ncbi:tigger transposable element-derived protein 4-like [Mercenaria mercenaria]|uniref:tigger transposable element-derived protein 4-like n=1 Tax=Mercenaria mercenaria TaxID=6596 RepID=UPI00234E5F26|nr:tigger transposable element-derived protein 4-like [Mercenaria mercenaria]
MSKRNFLTLEKRVEVIRLSESEEKIKPLVIGKSKNPRCFSGIKQDRLPVMYKSNKKAWMTGEIFEEWLHWFDRQMKGRKVLLFVDNAPSHPQVNLKNVNVKFLPPNTTSLCQPMDQGIIQAMKLKYRKKQLQYVISQMELKQGKSGFDLLKDISVLDAIYWVARAFKEVEISTIVKCFAKCGFQLNSVESESECTVLNDSESDEEEDDNYSIALEMKIFLVHLLMPRALSQAKNL